MGTLTLKLPDSLHQYLDAQAKREGIPLDQYVVSALARYNAPSYEVRQLSEQEIAQRRERFEELQRSLRRGTPEQVWAALDRRDVVEPEAELKPEIVERLQQRIAEARRIAESEQKHREAYEGRPQDPEEIAMWVQEQDWGPEYKTDTDERT